MGARAIYCYFQRSFKKLPILLITSVLLAVLNVYVLHKYNQLKQSISKSQISSLENSSNDNQKSLRSAAQSQKLQSLNQKYKIFPTELTACNELIAITDDKSPESKTFELFALQHKPTLAGFLNFYENELDKQSDK